MVLVKKETCFFSLAATVSSLAMLRGCIISGNFRAAGALLQSQFLGNFGTRLRLLVVAGGWLFAIGFSREKERTDRHREFPSSPDRISSRDRNLLRHDQFPVAIIPRDKVRYIVCPDVGRVEVAEGSPLSMFGVFVGGG